MLGSAIIFNNFAPWPASNGPGPPRTNGATLSEIVAKMSWQKHTVRGFMAGAMKKAGYAVESFKPDGGERSYRLPK
jgi:hypothetical protein